MRLHLRERLRRWMDRRLARIAADEVFRPEHAEQLALIGFSLNAEGNRWEARFKDEGPENIVRRLAENLSLFFVKYGGENYLEMSMYHPETGPLILSLQRALGKTPHQLRVAAEAERDAANERSARYAERANAMELRWLQTAEELRQLRSFVRRARENAAVLREFDEQIAIWEAEEERDG